MSSPHSTFESDKYHQCGWRGRHRLHVDAFVVRDLGVDRNHEDLGKSMHHGVNEVWSNDYAKWVLLDAKYDIHYERAGTPLSALQVWIK